MLTPPVPPIEYRGPFKGEVSDAVREAMRAALSGDFAALDRLEIEFLNLLVRIGELRIVRPDGTPHTWGQSYLMGTDLLAPFVTGIARGFGPDARMALEWRLAEKCRHCAGLLRHVPCRICDGRWWVRDVDNAELYTDLNGTLIEEHA